MLADFSGATNVADAAAALGGMVIAGDVDEKIDLYVIKCANNIDNTVCLDSANIGTAETIGIRKRILVALNGELLRESFDAWIKVVGQ